MRTGRWAVLALVVGLSLAVPFTMAAEPPKEPQAREFVYRVKFDEAAKPDKAALLARTVKVVRQRLGRQGAVEAQGDDRFVVKLKPVTDDDANRLDLIITKRGMLRFSLVDDNPENVKAARRGENVPGCTPFLPERDPKTGEIIRDAPSSANEIGRVVRWRKATFKDAKGLPEEISDNDWLLVENKVHVTGEYLSRAEAEEDPQTSAPVIGFALDGKGRADFEELTDRYKRTDEHRGRRLAIILDDELYSAPEINSRISGAGIITGKFTKREVENLVNVLRAGQLPAPVERVPAAEPGK